MDTRRLEQIGETLITSKLLETGILPAKPFFDHFGADLIGFTSIADQGRFCRIQCKYRTLKQTASISVDSSYVTGAFILFVCLQTDSKKCLYCFTADEVRNIFTASSVRSKAVLRLAISVKNASVLSQYDYLEHPTERIAAIFDLMKKASPIAEIRRAFSGLSAMMKEVSDIQRKRDDLKELIHKAEVLELEKNANDAQIAILKEYAEVLKSQIRQKQRKKKRSNKSA